MQTNNLDIKAISPKNGDKYSPNLYKFLTSSRREITAMYGQVYRDKQGILWLGHRDEDGWFMGARLIAVLCQGRRVGTFAHPPLMGMALRSRGSGRDTLPRAAVRSTRHTICTS